MAIEIVNGETDLSLTREKFEEFTQGVAKSNGEYSIVAIMGGQSGGKSTLLNHLFGTDFATLNSSQDRQATTKGIWLGRPASTHHPGGLLVIDCEGSDSDEKDEGLVETFARQSALFSLALAEVLIVNLWAHDIGKRQGQNLPVLETIFEVNLSLFQDKHNNRTKLLFIIRDHIEAQTPLEVEQQTVMRNINLIWNRINKPDRFKDALVSDVFDIEFIPLPHLMLMKDQFITDVGNLKRRFGDPSEKDSLWATDYHFNKSRDVPLKHLYDYVQQMWHAIKDRDELNIVSQKASLTNTLCEKHVETAFSEFRQNLESANLESDLLKSGFGATCKEMLNKAVASYDEETFVSQADKDNIASELGEIKHKRRDQLIEKVMNECSRLFDRRMHAVVEACTELFEKHLKKDIPHDGTAISNLNQSVFNANTLAKQELLSIRADSMVPDGPEWDADNTAFDELKKRVKKIAAEVRKQQWLCLKDEAKRLLKSKFAPKVSSALKEGREDLWDSVHAARVKAADDIEALLKAKIDGFLCKDDEFQSLYTGFRCKDDEVRSLQKEIDAAILSTIREESLQNIQFIDQLLLRKFDSIFRLDSDGVPRVWQKNDDTRPTFLEAKKLGLDTLKMYAKFELGSNADEKHFRDMDPDDKIFITDEKMFDIERRYLQTIEGALREAQNQMSNRIEAVPIWAMIMIAILGYNEFTSILFSPIFLPIFILFGSIFVVIYMMGLTDQAVQLVMLVVQPAIQKLGQRFSPTAMLEAMQNPAPQRPPAAVEMQETPTTRPHSHATSNSNGTSSSSDFSSTTTRRKKASDNADYSAFNGESGDNDTVVPTSCKSGVTKEVIQEVRPQGGLMPRHASPVSTR